MFVLSKKPNELLQTCIWNAIKTEKNIFMSKFPVLFLYILYSDISNLIARNIFYQIPIDTINYKRLFVF